MKPYPHMNVHSSIVRNGQKLETIQISINWWIKQNVYPKNGVIFSNKREWSATIEMATHSSISAWEVPWTEEPGGLQSMRSQKSRTLPSHSTTTTKNRQTSETHCDVKEASHKDHILYDSLYMKCAEKANLQRQKADLSVAWGEGWDWLQGGTRDLFGMMEMF